MPFACIGLVGSLVFTFGPLHDIHRWNVEDKLGGIITWMYAWLALSVVLFAVQLAGAILAVIYKPMGLRLLTGYAVGALVLVAIDLSILHGFMPRITEHDVHGSVTVARSIFDCLALPWPVVVAILVNSRSARTACQGP